MPGRPLTLSEQKLLRDITVHCVMSPASHRRTRLRCRYCGYAVVLSMRGIGAEAMTDHLADCDKRPPHPSLHIV